MIERGGWHAAKMTFLQWWTGIWDQAKGYKQFQPIVYFFFLLYYFAVVYEYEWTNVIYHVNSTAEKKYENYSLALSLKILII